MLTEERKQRDKERMLERRSEILEALPLLLDECDECGANDSVRVFRYTPNGRYSPTGLRGEAHNGRSWETLKQIAKANDVLCARHGREKRENP